MLHVIGGGLAGLTAAWEAGRAGLAVTLYEASPQPGGRCRTLAQAQLGEIDNGNHLVMQANTTMMALLQRLGTLPDCYRLTAIPLLDAATGRIGQQKTGRWHLLRGHLPGGSLSGWRQIWQIGYDLCRRKNAPITVAEMVKDWPNRALHLMLARSVLNTPPEAASAGMYQAVLRQLLLKSAVAYVPRHGWGEVLIAPLIHACDQQGVRRIHARVTALNWQKNQLRQICFGNETINIEQGDQVILAVPWGQAHRLLPEAVPPAPMHHSIVNGHFDLRAVLDAAAIAALPPVTGLVNDDGVEWVFRRGWIASTTSSAAGELAARHRIQQAEICWQAVRRAFGIANSITPPTHRIITEKRATFSATEAALALRPAAATRLHNVRLAGDYVQSALPATLEAAARSGRLAACWAKKHAKRQV